MTRLLHMLAVLTLLCLMPHSGAAQEADTAPPSANDLHEFTRLLADPRIQDWIATQADPAQTDADRPRTSLREELMGLVGETRARLAELAQARVALPFAVPLLRDRWQAELTPGAQVRGLTFVMIFLFVGAGLEWLYRQYTQPLSLRIELEPVTSQRARIAAALKRALISAGGLAIFALGSVGVFAAFSWTPAQETLVLNLLLVVVTVRAVRRLLVFFLAPSVPELRLLPVDTATARYLTRLLLALTAVFVFAGALMDVYARITGGDNHEPHTIGITAALAVLVFATTVAVIVAGFSHVCGRTGTRSDRTLKLWRIYLIALSFLVLTALVLDRAAFGLTLALLGLLAPGLRLLRLWVDAAIDQATADRMPPVAEHTDDADPEADSDPETVPEHAIEPAGDIAAFADPDAAQDAIRAAPYDSYRPIARRLAQFIAVFCVGGAIAWIWGFNLFERAAAPTFSGRIVTILIDSTVAILIADLIWVWASTVIDRRLAAYVPPHPGQAPGPEARMATLLPLLRVVLMVTLLIMVSMSVLSSLGVNIAPILAGAGVVGIAIGFGTQSLVKDVVSGIFFLIDDAFRIGEYVEIDQLRGTVEKISIRSLQIRHHRGAIHTLPFGELRHLTNHSRDWVIVKLEFRVPFETDLMLVKKIIKKIGAQMEEHPEYGPGILETLKSQGVRRMEEFNMVVGVKFMTRPGEQWLVRRDAYQMVRDAFEENGIRMAERNVKVEVANAANMTAAEREAVAGAAQLAIEAPTGPRAPIPDEP